MSDFKDSNLNKTLVDEIDILELLKILWSRKFLLIIVFLLSSIISVVYTLSLPNKYQSTVVLVPAEQSSMDSALSQYGGLASLAGVNIPTKIDKSTIALEILKSRLFVQNFINNRDILVPLMASKDWDLNNNELVLDLEIYDPINEKWLRKPSAKKKSKPSLQEAYALWMNETFSSSKNIKNGVVYITILHVSPNISQQWAEWLIEDLNKYMRESDVNEAELSIEYLTKEVKKTNSEELKSLFFKLIQSNTETKMLAYSRSDYIFRVIDPPIVPEEKVLPNRAYLSIIGSFLGTVLGVLFVLIQHYIARQRN
jgi:LPS O-antigen subunit length determinant protein (WzzB/FepE family)